MMTREEWLAARRSGIGGTDISAILGLHPYRTAFDVFLDKIGEGKEIIENTPMKMGKALEPIIAGLYEEATKKKLIESGLVIHPKYDFILGSPDRLVIDEDLGVEIKTLRFLNDEWGDEFSDNIPQHYLLQVIWYMMLTCRSIFDVAVLISGQDFRIYRVNRDRDLEEVLIERAKKFWMDHILTKQPPEIDGSESAAEYLNNKFSKNNSLLLEASDDANKWAEKLDIAKQELEIAEQNKLLAENNLKALISDYDGVVGDTWKATWKCSKDSKRVDWQALAEFLGANQEYIDRYTIIKPGNKRFLFSKK